jgi:hypothetical protein
MLRGKFIAISATLKKKKQPETSQINNLMIHLKLLEKQELKKKKKNKTQNKQTEIIKIGAEINEIKTKQTIQKNQ